MGHSGRVLALEHWEIVTSNRWGQRKAELSILQHTVVWRGEPGPVAVARMEKDTGDRGGCGDREGHRGWGWMSGKFSSLPT